ncbi:MAG: hypothetical protein ACYCSF_02965 [Acidimicrobiales bacterium]
MGFESNMGDAPLHHLLDTDTGPEQHRQALGAVVARHRRRRAARLKTATVCLILVVGSAGLGLGLSQSSTGRAVVRSAARATTGAALQLKFVHGAVAVPISAASGGFSSALTATAPTRTTNEVAAVCRLFGCGATGISKIDRIAGRTAQGASISSYVVTLSAVGSGGERRAASSAATTSHPVLPQDLLPCEAKTELVVRVSVGGTPQSQVTVPMTLGVGEPFEALAEALVLPAGGRPVLIAVAQVAPSVRRVTASFEVGTFDSTKTSHDWAVLVGRAADGSLAAHDSVDLVARSATNAVLERVNIPAPGLVGVAAASCPGAGS